MLIQVVVFFPVVEPRDHQPESPKISITSCAFARPAQLAGVPPEIVRMVFPVGSTWGCPASLAYRVARKTLEVVQIADPERAPEPEFAVDNAGHSIQGRSSIRAPPQTSPDWLAADSLDGMDQSPARSVLHRTSLFKYRAGYPSHTYSHREHCPNRPSHPAAGHEPPHQNGGTG